MPCNQAENALLYAYGELEESKTPAFLAHLKECKECQNTLHICALATASLKPQQAPEFVIPAQEPAAKKAFSFDFGFLQGLKRRAIPALVFGAFALVIGFTAFEGLSTKKPMVSAPQSISFDFEDMDTDLTDLETEISEMFEYMQEI